MLSTCCVLLGYTFRNFLRSFSFRPTQAVWSCVVSAEKGDGEISDSYMSGVFVQLQTASIHTYTI